MGEVVVPIEDDGSMHVLPLYSPPTTTPLEIITVKSTWIKDTPVAGQAGSGPPDVVDLRELESWLPLTESRNGTIFSAVFHLLCSGLGFQALLLPAAFSSLGWTWGIICLSIAYTWQLYTAWLLVNLHEPVPGTRCSRFVRLSIIAFGQKLGKLLAIFPVMYLSGGSCVMLIITGGNSMKQFFNIICEQGTMCGSKSLSGTHWFLIFTCVALIIGQLPNLNSIARVSLTGAITSIGYITMISALSIGKGRTDGVSYNVPDAEKTGMARFGDISNAIGIIMLAFRGHNLILEIQGTLPSESKHSCRTSMWRGVMVSYIIIPMCLFPLAVVGFWAYGDKIPAKGVGILTAFAQFREHDTSKFMIGLIYLWLAIACITSYQIYAMPAFDNLEFVYASNKKRRCPGWVRVGLRLFFGGLTLLIAVAFPFLGSLAPLIGGLAAVPLTFAYPCFMWISIRKPGRNSGMWSVNMGLGCFGIILSILLIVAAVWNLADQGLNANFFSP
ncbi:Lysine histidine transporter-like 8, putative isoform 2 [Hibiscus syriacus]|uniref:Lysine histidine transporter-like 8, putative isoform 2 n=1 Tax=Hibiscus syriacus TaxID=106335 RepID=A0A6A3CCN6_HIBSY|nr:lysine histidine transporter-like 7 [Hibiscus syriacus]KAE8724919.1 Lysine histidine transporter-like 8, putative isoform 2 [Hibiscus syriacus]